MDFDFSLTPLPRGLLRDQIQLLRREDSESERYEMVRIYDQLPFGKGVYAVIRACQLLAEKKDGLILVGLAGPSGAGKTFLAEKVQNFMPNIAIIDMASYRNLTPQIDENFDDPRLTDYNTLLENIHGLRDGQAVHVPIYDFKSSSRIGNRKLEVPSSRIVILKGIYTLSDKLRHLLDLRVSVTGGVHFDLVKRVLRDIQRPGQEPKERIHQITETVYPMYKAKIEPNLNAAHIHILNKFNPFTCIQNPTYVLKSTKAVTPEQMKAALSENVKERTEETYDIYLLPPDKDPETCQSFLRMRNRDGKYILMFEEWVTDGPFIISPRVTFEVSVRVLGGLMALGYTIPIILKRKSHIFDDDTVIVKTDLLEQLKQTYVQVQGKDRSLVKNVADQLGLEGSYVPHTYIEQIQQKRLVNDVLVLPDDLKIELSLDDDTVSSPKDVLSRAYGLCKTNYLQGGGIAIPYTSERQRRYSISTRLAAKRALDSNLPNQGVNIQLPEQISILNERMDELTLRIDELKKNSIATSSGQRQIMHQMDTLSNLFREYVEERSRLESLKSSRTRSFAVYVPICIAVGCLGIFAYKSPEIVGYFTDKTQSS